MDFLIEAVSPYLMLILASATIAATVTGAAKTAFRGHRRQWRAARIHHSGPLDPPLWDATMRYLLPSLAGLGVGLVMVYGVGTEIDPGEALLATTSGGALSSAAVAYLGSSKHKAVRQAVRHLQDTGRLTRQGDEAEARALEEALGDDEPTDPGCPA